MSHANFRQRHFISYCDIRVIRHHCAKWHKIVSKQSKIKKNRHKVYIFVTQLQTQIFNATSELSDIIERNGIILFENSRHQVYFWERWIFNSGLEIEKMTLLTQHRAGLRDFTIWVVQTYESVLVNAFSNRER